MDSAKFWSEAERRRNLFFYWWVGWLPAGGIAVVAYELILGVEPPFPLMVVVLLSWGAAWYYIKRRITKLSCPQCGMSAFRNPYFFMRNARCQHCGYNQAAA